MIRYTRHRAARLVLLGSLAALACTVRPSTALAQQSGVQVGVAYDFGFEPALGDLLTNGGSFPAGWAVSANGRIRGPVQVVGELSGSYKTSRDRLAEYPTFEHSALGGVRLRRSWLTTSVYAELLAGVTRWRAGGWYLPGDLDATAVAWQPGIGVERSLSRRAVWRLALHSRIIADDSLARALYRHGNTITSWHARVGVAYRVGQ